MKELSNIFSKKFKREINFEYDGNHENFIPAYNVLIDNKICGKISSPSEFANDLRFYVRSRLIPLPNNYKNIEKFVEEETLKLMTNKIQQFINN